MKIIIRHPGGTKTSPSTSRLLAFKDYFNKIGFSDCDILKSDIAIAIKCLVYFFRREKCNIFLSMPPFRGWQLLLLPFVNFILDIRDGWSISIASGYGGNAIKRPFKACIARKIERWAIKRALVTITCTNGLKTHLEKVSGKSIILAANGISNEDLEIIQNIKSRTTFQKNSNKILFVCTGKFSEYGHDKVMELLTKIAHRYSRSADLVIRLIGCNKNENNWVRNFFHEATGGTGHVEILPHMEKQTLFESVLECDFGLCVIRDPSYDFGTKVFDYIALGLPIVNYFDEPNNFTEYFDACLDVPFSKEAIIPEIRRSVLIESALKNIKW